jgi:hypothetical protein
MTTDNPQRGLIPVFPLALASNFDTLPYLPLGMVATYLRAYSASILTRDYRIERVRIGGVAGYSLDSAYDGIANARSCLCLLSSYVWNNDINLAAARDIRAQNPGAIIIIGGPEVPKYAGETEAFLRANPAIDIAVLGEGEVTCAEVLGQLAQHGLSIDALREIPGIVYRTAQEIVRTGDRQRLKTLDELPSPYLLKEFDDWFLDREYAVLETNRGCPYGCTYCDWGSATLEKVNKFDPQRVLAEINYIVDRRAKTIFIADANFGMLEQDIEIAQGLVAARKRTGFPARIFTNFAKNGGRRLMAVTKILHEGGLLATGIIALQTTDERVLHAIKRDNIKTTSYEKLMAYFNSENIPMASDLMIGLPGQTIDSLQQDLQFCFDWKVSANGNYTSMMPNAPMAEKTYREAFKIVSDGGGMIASTSTFTADELTYMKSLYMVYQFHVSIGVLKYYLYYLQIEHEVPAIALLRLWMDAVLAGDTRLPMSRRLYLEVFNMESRSGDWALMSWGDEAEFFFASFESYLDEFHQFALAEYGITVEESSFSCLKLVQQAVMPKPGRKYPYRVQLPHNAWRYFKQIQAVPSLRELKSGVKPLHSYAPDSLLVAPYITRDTISYVKHDGHTDSWELTSSLKPARNHSVKKSA